MPTDDLEPLFAPESVAFIGASEDNDRFCSLYDNATTTDRPLDSYFVNPNRDSVFGETCFDSIRAVPVSVDLAVIVVPAAVVPTVFEECGQADVGAAVVVSAGFGEAGDAGRDREQQLRALSDTYDLPFCGPNTFGLLSMHDRTILAQVASTDIPSGNVGAVLQSGGLLNQLLASGRQRGIGFSKVLDSGNEASLSTAAYCEHLIEDDETDVIVGVIEGFTEPERFLDVAEKAADERVPLIVLKLAQSATGQDIAQSHTGAVATPADVVSAVFDQYGVVQVDSFDELIEAAVLFSNVETLTGPGVGVVEISGGGCTLFSDAIDDTALALPSLSAAATERIQEVMPPIGVARNPVDLAMGWQTEQMAEAHPAVLEALTGESDIDLVISRLSIPESGELGPIADRLAELQRATADSATTFAVVSRASSCVSDEWIRAVSGTDVPFLQEYHKAARTLDSLAQYATFTDRFERERQRPVGESPRPDFRPSSSNQGQLETSGTVTEFEAKQLLAESGFPTVDEQLVRSRTAALEAADDIGYPVCLKIAGTELQHTSDVGGVVTDIQDPDALRATYSELEAIAERTIGTDSEAFQGILVQEMIVGGQELLVGSKRTPFGQAVVVGLGGIFTEVLDDTAIRIAPITSETGNRMLQELDGFEVLTGARDRDAVDVDALCELLATFSTFAAANEQLLEADLNPVIASADGVTIVDALFQVADESGSGSRDRSPDHI